MGSDVLTLPGTGAIPSPASAMRLMNDGCKYPSSCEYLLGGLLHESSALTPALCPDLRHNDGRPLGEGLLARPGLRIIRTGAYYALLVYTCPWAVERFRVWSMASLASTAALHAVLVEGYSRR